MTVFQEKGANPRLEKTRNKLNPEPERKRFMPTVLERARDRLKRIGAIFMRPISIFRRPFKSEEHVLGKPVAKQPRALESEALRKYHQGASVENTLLKRKKIKDTLVTLGAIAAIGGVLALYPVARKWIDEKDYQRFLQNTKQEYAVHTFRFDMKERAVLSSVAQKHRITEEELIRAINNSMNRNGTLKPIEKPMSFGDLVEKNLSAPDQLNPPKQVQESYERRITSLKELQEIMQRSDEQNELIRRIIGKVKDAKEPQMPPSYPNFRQVPPGK